MNPPREMKREKQRGKQRLDEREKPGGQHRSVPD